jgi:small subunit ribosomal protein S3
MGQKVNPIGLRLGYIRDWDSRWYARQPVYAEWAIEDVRVRRMLRERFADGGSRSGRGPRDAGISRIEVERAPNLLKLTLHTARPGIIIGRGGRGVEDMRAEIERIVRRKVHINVQEISQPELDAYLVAENIASQIERRIAFKRAVRQALQRTMKTGAKGIRVLVSGRLGGSEMSRRYADREGKIPLHTLRADIDYGFTEARTPSGNIGVKVWVYRGDVLPPAPTAPPKAAPAVAAERPHRGWRRVGGARRAMAEGVGQAAPEPAAEAPPAPVEQVAEAAGPPPEQQIEEPKTDVDAGEGQVPEAT